MIKYVFNLCRSIVILYVMLWLGERVETWLPIGVPASIWGLLFLFLGLVLQLIKVRWIQVGANLFIRYMALLFIPICVGIIQYTDLLVEQGKSLLIPNIVSTLTTLILFALLSDYVFSRRGYQRVKKRTNLKKNG
ncbi:CidA/LrgA family protein [Conservatibacter flavescens]|uniref:Uncharacterized protein n=1 Tax=Conservatibacter flavescens TaxID=28161 RepID=A0A2M8S610_9PAST|nr:CidA/LrgA family protein [Conservatibacter flavescens]PJG86564.1 hypothetical protein CVP05_01795 [Conservatibacter flavescens]